MHNDTQPPKTCKSDGNIEMVTIPNHNADLRPFEIGKYPVTQKQYKAYCKARGIMRPDDAGFGRKNRPVINVSWNDAQDFCAWANEVELDGKLGWRLLSEAEWEYACRAGEDHLYSGSNDIDAVAWYDGNSGGKTHPVGQKPANAWGLYDMSGNVWEWVQDTYTSAPTDGDAWGDGYWRVLRGGSWSIGAWGTRAAFRNYGTPTDRFSSVGFRLARTLP